MTGTIKRLMKEKGYGFIRSTDSNGTKEIFFHRSAVRGGSFEDLNEGDSVTFQEAAPSEKGLRAASVRLG